MEKASVGPRPKKQNQKTTGHRTGANRRRFFKRYEKTTVKLLFPKFGTLLRSEPTHRVTMRPIPETITRNKNNLKIDKAATDIIGMDTKVEPPLDFWPRIQQLPLVATIRLLCPGQ